MHTSGQDECQQKGVHVAWCACVCRSQLEVIPRNSSSGGRPMSTVSAGGSLGRGSRALHLQHHQSSLSALHMTANHSGTVDRRRSSLRVTYRIDSKTHTWSHFTTAPGTRWYFSFRCPCILPLSAGAETRYALNRSLFPDSRYISLKFSPCFAYFALVIACCPLVRRRN